MDVDVDVIVDGKEKESKYCMQECPYRAPCRLAKIRIRNVNVYQVTTAGSKETGSQKQP